MDVVFTELLTASTPPGSASESPSTPGTSQPFDATLLQMLGGEVETNPEAAALAPPSQATKDDAAAMQVALANCETCANTTDLSPIIPPSLGSPAAKSTEAQPLAAERIPLQAWLKGVSLTMGKWSPADHARAAAGTQPANGEAALGDASPVDQSDGLATGPLVIYLPPVNYVEQVTTQQREAEVSDQPTIPLAADATDLESDRVDEMPAESRENPVPRSTPFPPSQRFLSPAPDASSLGSNPAEAVVPTTATAAEAASEAVAASIKTGTPRTEDSPIAPHPDASSTGSTDVDIPPQGPLPRELPRLVLVRTEQGGRYAISSPTDNGPAPKETTEPASLKIDQSKAADPLELGTLKTAVPPTEHESDKEPHGRAERSAKSATPPASDAVANEPTWQPPTAGPTLNATHAAPHPTLSPVINQAPITDQQQPAWLAPTNESSAAEVSAPATNPSRAHVTDSAAGVPTPLSLEPHLALTRSDLTGDVSTHVEVSSSTGEPVAVATTTVQPEVSPVAEASLSRVTNFGLNTWSGLSTVTLASPGLRREPLSTGNSGKRTEPLGLDPMVGSTSAWELAGPTSAKEIISSRTPDFAAASPVRQVADLVSTSIGLRQNTDKPTLEATLSPPDLGRIRIEIHTQGEQLSARIFVAEHSTLSLLRSTLPELRDQLQQMGVHTDSLALTAWNEHAANTHSDSRHKELDYFSEDAARPMLKSRQLPGAPQGRGTQRVDVRL